MKKEESKGRELAILISQARQLEATAKLATYKSSESLEEQYHRLRDNLVSLDPDANKCLPDFRRKGYGGTLIIDLGELLEKVKMAINQINAYLDAMLTQTNVVTEPKSVVGVREIKIPQEVLQNLPKEVKKTIDGILYNYQGGFIDFCFWGMRKALIDAIRIRFMKDGKEKILYDKKGDSYKLSKWIELAKQQKYVSGSTAKQLNNQLKVFGDAASHDYMTNLQKEEVPTIMTLLRIALSTMYYQEKERT
jgi:hypothetical protein